MAKRPTARAARLEDAPLLDPKDFRAFEKHKWSDPEFNAERLLLKRKLQAMGEPVRDALAAAGEPLQLRTSIHNPYKFNGNRVDSLRFYLSPSDKAKQEIKSLLGVDFAEDTDASYVGVNLVFVVAADEVRLGLRVHERAWWDVQNVRNRCATREGAEGFAAALNGVVGGYDLTMHNWQKRYPCGQLRWDDAMNYFRYLEPGVHRMQVARSIRKDAPELFQPGLCAMIAREFESLLPVYRFILWSPSNSHLGMKGAR